MISQESVPHLYDALNRLTLAEGPWGVETYAYDDVGNRLTRTLDGASDTYDYDAASNRLNQVTNGQAVAYQYDANGNITAMGAKTLVYNQANRLVQVQEGGQALADYVYNAMNQRVSKTVSGELTVFLYDFKGQLICEADNYGEINREYLYNGRNLQAMVDVSAGKIYFYQNDHLKTPLRLTDKNGIIVWEGVYMPFGYAYVNPLHEVTNNIRFAGQYYDSETGLHYNYHRYYDPGTGRYLTPDPIGLAGGINLYAYVQNNPVNFVDPYGLIDWRLMGQVWWEDISSGAARDRVFQAINAELSIFAGIAELYLTAQTGGAAGAFIGMHGVGNLAGGIGDYLDIYNTDDCDNRDWNITRQGYENLFEMSGGNPEWGARAFYLTDAGIGVAGMMSSVPAFQRLPYGIERYYHTTSAAQASRAVVAHDTLQIMTGIKSGAE